MHFETRSIEDQVWLVTGASSGLGRALCHAILRRGGRVVAAVRQPDGTSFDGLTPAAIDRSIVVGVDVTNPAQVNAGVACAIDRFGTLDVIVNCAGRGSFGSLEETPLEELRSLFEINVIGSLNVLKAALPVFRKQRYGHIVQISSLAGVAPPAAGLGAYAATKFALEGLSEVLAKEVRNLGIRVTIVEPGDFRTNFGASLHITPSEIDDYTDSVGRAGASFAALDSRDLGDPRKAAVAILDAVNSGEPPMRLALGSDATAAILDALISRLEEAQKWERAGQRMQ